MEVILSPSIAYGCIELLEVLDKQSLKNFDLNSLVLGPCPISEVVLHVRNLGWIEEDITGKLSISRKGRLCLDIGGSIRRLRYLLHEYLLTRNDPWIQLSQRGRSHVLLQAPLEITQLFYEADLAESDDVEVVRFWDGLAERVRTGKLHQNLEIGRLGERLTIEYETRRVEAAPSWVAINGNQFGYDILSRTSAVDETPLKIEVKCTHSTISSARFHLTRHEWETARVSKSYVFHLWSVQESSRRLAILSVSDVGSHVPEDVGMGMWDSLIVPYKIFENVFSFIE